MNKSNINQLSAETEADSNSTAQNQQVSQPNVNTNVIGSAFKSYWVICVNSYEYDNKEIPKGRMNMHYSQRPIISRNWRRATENEINTKKWFKGNYFNLGTV